MKKLLIILLSFIALNIYSQDSTRTTSVGEKDKDKDFKVGFGTLYRYDLKQVIQVFEFGWKNYNLVVGVDFDILDKSVSRKRVFYVGAKYELHF